MSILRTTATLLVLALTPSLTWGQTCGTELLSGQQGQAGNSSSNRPSVSFDGNWVLFDTAATDLVADDTNAFNDVILCNRTTGELIRASRPYQGLTPDNAAAARATLARACPELPLTRIGRVTSGPVEVTFLLNGSRVDVGAGFRHA